MQSAHAQKATLPTPSTDVGTDKLHYLPRLWHLTYAPTAVGSARYAKPATQGGWVGFRNHMMHVGYTAALLGQ